MLSPAEKALFLAWLERETSDATQIITQLHKLGPHTAVIVEHKNKEIAAMRVIINMLRGMH